jgi:hypothetical protein
LAKINSTLSLLAAGSVALGIKTLMEYKPLNQLKINPLPETHGENKQKISFIIAHSNQPQTSALIADLLAQEGLKDLEILVNENLLAIDNRVKNLFNEADLTPEGWSEVAWNCQKLAFAAEGEILVFINPRVLISSNLFISAMNYLNANQLTALFVNPKIKNPLNLNYLDEVGRSLLTFTKLQSELAISPDLLIIHKDAYNRIAGHTRVGTNPDLGVGLLKVLQQHELAVAIVNGRTLLTVDEHRPAKRELTPLDELAVRSLTYLAPLLVFIFSRSRSLKLLGLVGIKLGSFLSFRQLANYKPINFQKIALTPLAALVSIILDSLAWWRKWRA